jgi:hypothetical protein
MTNVQSGVALELSEDDDKTIVAGWLSSGSPRQLVRIACCTYQRTHNISVDPKAVRWRPVDSHIGTKQPVHWI